MKNGEFHPPESEHQCPAPADMNVQYATSAAQSVPAATGACFVTSASAAPPAQFGSVAIASSAPIASAISAAVASPALPAISTMATSGNGATSGGGGIYASSHIDPGVPSQHLSLEELGIDMEAFPMDLCEQQLEPVTPVTGGVANGQPAASASVTVASAAEFMDVDGDWLERLISDELDHSAPSSASAVGHYESLHCANNNNNIVGGCDPSIADSLDFFNIDDNDLKIAAELSWDRVDFAT